MKITFNNIKNDYDPLKKPSIFLRKKERNLCPRMQKEAKNAREEEKLENTGGKNTERDHRNFFFFVVYIH